MSSYKRFKTMLTELKELADKYPDEVVCVEMCGHDRDGYEVGRPYNVWVRLEDIVKASNTYRG